MDLRLSGRTALVLGGTRGLGLACARSLTESGVRVLLNGRDRQHGDAIAAGLPGAVFVAGDIGSDGDRARMVDAVTRIAAPDIVVTNAGGPPAGPFAATDVTQWRKAFDTSIAGPLEVVRAFLPAMRARGIGRIVYKTFYVVKG